MGRYILSVVDFRKDASRNVRGPVFSATYFEWAFTNRRPNLSNGGRHLPDAEAGQYQFDPPRTFPSSKAVALRDALDGCQSDPEEIVMKLRAVWGSVRSLGPPKRRRMFRVRGPPRLPCSMKSCRRGCFF